MEWKTEAVGTLQKLAQRAELSAGDSDRCAQMLEVDRRDGAAWWRRNAARQRGEAEQLRECAALLQR